MLAEEAAGQADDKAIYYRGEEGKGAGTNLWSQPTHRAESIKEFLRYPTPSLFEEQDKKRW